MSPRAIKSAERTLKLFELFARRQEALTVGEVARGLEIPPPSASMLLHNLQQLGYLERDRATRAFAPSIRVVLLGSWVCARNDGARSLASRLDAFYEEVGEAVFVGCQNGAFVQIVQHRMAGGNVSIDSGQLYSLTDSAVGRALLALSDDREVLQLVRRCNAEVASQKARVNESGFMDLLGQVRRQGYAETHGEVQTGRAGIAIPVASPIGGRPPSVAPAPSIAWLKSGVTFWRC
jgi:IclR family KDG regulon transcriptional repressor